MGTSSLVCDFVVEDVGDEDGEVVVWACARH